MSGPKRILAVDDEEYNLVVLKALLKSLGHEAVPAASGAEAMELYTNGIDLILLDVMMPGMDGFEVVRRIRASSQANDIPVIMVTALTSKEDRLTAVEAGANDFVSKPIDKVELRVRMDSLLKMKEAQDAIRRHQAELETTVEKRTAALTQSERRYRSLFEDSLDAICVVRRNGTLEDVNGAFLDLTGYERQELETVRFGDLFADSRLSELFREQAEAEGIIRDLEWTLRHKDGVLRDCLLSASVRRSEQSEILGYQAVIHDVTDRKRVEEALKESEKRMRLLIESSPIGIMIASNGQYSYVNSAFVSMFGRETSDEIVGTPIEQLCAPEDRDLFMSRVRSAETGSDEGVAHEMRGLIKTGEQVHLSVWLTMTEYAGAPALLGFMVDVSKEKELKARLLQSQKLEALGTLAGGIAHDFNNILFAVTGFTELALDEVPPETRAHSNLRRILEAADRATGVVKQILTFCREGEQIRRPIDVSPLIKETLRFIRASIPASIEIKRSLGPNVGKIMADPTQIHQLLMNLCTNAAHAMKESGGVLTLELERLTPDHHRMARFPDLPTGHYLSLRVSDTGHGMSGEVQERIFDPYFTTKKQGEGTGLGLALVHGIVRRHEGEIAVESEPGSGTTFEILFPEFTRESEAHRTSQHDLPSGTERILLVDDELPLLEMGYQMLTGLGYDATTCSDAREALELITRRDDHYDAVITDMSMPGMDGIRLAQELGTIRPGVPVILCTGFSDEMNEEKALELGVAAFVLKPILKKDMAETLRRVLDACAAKET
jgi:PAS domain S-box-containing protein